MSNAKFMVAPSDRNIVTTLLDDMGYSGLYDVGNSTTRSGWLLVDVQLGDPTDKEEITKEFSKKGVRWSMEEMKQVIESTKLPQDIISDILTEEVEEFSGVKFDTEYWRKEFGLGDFEDALSEYSIDDAMLKKVGEAIKKINKEGMQVIGGQPEQRLYSQGSMFVVDVGGRADRIPFNDQPKFNCHVLYFAMENGDPTNFLEE